MAGDVAVLGGYDIYYAGDFDFSSICIMVTHDLHPMLTFNDPRDGWLCRHAYREKSMNLQMCMPLRLLPCGLKCGILL